MLKIEEKHLKIAKEILSKYPYSFYIFGSRVKGGAKKLSDIDLCFFDKIPEKKLMELEEDFEESNLPYKVDIVDWHKCDTNMQKIIKKDMVCLQENSQQPK